MHGWWARSSLLRTVSPAPSPVSCGSQDSIEQSVKINILEHENSGIGCNHPPFSLMIRVRPEETRTYPNDTGSHSTVGLAHLLFSQAYPASPCSRAQENFPRHSQEKERAHTMHRFLQYDKPGNCNARLLTMSQNGLMKQGKCTAEHLKKGGEVSRGQRASR